MRVEFLDITLQLHHYLISSISIFLSHTNTKITSKHNTIQASSSSLSFFLSNLDLILSSLVISICKSSIAVLVQWRPPSKNPLFPSRSFRSQNQSNRRPRIQKQHPKLPSQRKPRSLKPESPPVLESPLHTLLTRRYYYYYY